VASLYFRRRRRGNDDEGGGKNMQKTRRDAVLFTDREGLRGGGSLARETRIKKKKEESGV